MTNSPATTPPINALIIDDEILILDILTELLKEMGVHTARAMDIRSAINSLGQFDFDFCITDLDLPDGSGFEIVHFITNNFPHLPVAVLTGNNQSESIVAAMQAGAFDYCTKPIAKERLQQMINTAHRLSKGAALSFAHETLMVGQSPTIKAINSMAHRLAQTNAPVLITGESGSGKELVARTIHQNSPRREAPFLAINCGAIPDNLLESEFFGHEKGAFTGAEQQKDGLFVAAHGGTIFLDEIADLPLSLQVKMLRVLQERTIRPVGSTQELPIDVRILSASHKDLKKEVAQGNFREDLYYRVNVITIAMPSLGEHLEDIPLLASSFLDKIARRDGKREIRISDQAISYLMQEEWPGNVRQLNNRLERAAALYQGEQIELADIQSADSEITAPKPPTTAVSATSAPIPDLPPATFLRLSGLKSLDNVLAKVEKSYLHQALEACKYNKTKAAKLLGINTRSLRYRLQKHDIDY